MNKFMRLLIVCAVIFLLSLACSLPGISNQDENEEPLPISPTATNTITGQVSSNTGTQCEGLTAQLEVFVMAGPGAAVGLEPFAIGKFPLSVSNQDESYIVSGGGPASYYDILTRDWGTYEVLMELDIEITGTCNPASDPNNLDLTVTMSGSQNVIVEAEGLSGEYPWEGSANVSSVLPISEGATASGEGWKLILHPEQ